MQYLTLGEAEDEVGVAKSTISRAVSKLTAAGFIESASSESDKREQLLRLSPAGQALYNELAPMARKVEAEVIAEMQNNNYDELKHALGTLESAMGILPTDEPLCKKI